MGTQGTGRKRSTKKERTTAEEDALNLIAREAEARLAAKRAARAEAREIRMKELERQQKELSDEDERMSVGSRGSVRVEDKDYLEKGSRAASALTATTLTSLGGTSSRRGSRDTALTVDAESAIREIKDALAEVEEKYRKAMVSNAQLDNEKNNLMYQVDTLKDSLMELEELLSESRREYEDKVREFEREKHAHGVLQFQFNEVKETLKQSEELLNEIRQLRLKQDAFVREISDLQETVEWKDKKIGALERQKEYTDAVRVERDELREEVVKLKDVLKKHGIILGPDLSVNGDAGEAEVDETPGVEPESRSAPDPQTSQPEGNGMLGSTEEAELRGCREEEVAAEQQETLEEDEKLLSPDALCNVVQVSQTETCLENQPVEEQEVCLRKEELISGESELIKDLNVDAIDCPDIGAKRVNIVWQNVYEIQTSPKESVPQTKTSEEETFEKSPGSTESTAVKPNVTELLEENSQQGPGEEGSLRTAELNPQENAAQVLQKRILAEESVPNTEPQQEPDNAEEANKDDGEEVPSKSQPQVSTASGKKKKKKRKSKKKGGSLDNKNQQKDKENVDKSEKNIKPALSNNEVTKEPDTSVTETLKTPPSDQISNEQDEQEPDQADAVEPAENCSQKELITDLVCNKVNTEETINAKTDFVGSSETLGEAKVELIKGDQNEGETLESEKIQLVKPTDSCSDRKTLQESITDHVSGEFEEGEPGPLENTDAVASHETPGHMETSSEARRENIEDVKNEDETLETEKMAEAVEATQSLSKRESFQEPVPDHVSDVPDKGKTTSEEAGAAISSETPRHTETPREARAEDVQNQEETLDTEKVESVGSSERSFLKEPFQELITDHVSDELSEGKTIHTEASEEAVVSCEMPCRPETLNKDGVERTEDEQNKEGILEMPKMEPEAKEPTESLSHVKSFEESVTDCKLGKDGGLMSLKVEEQESTNSPGPKTSPLKSELTEDPNEEDILIIDTTTRGENSNSGEVQTPSETVDEMKRETTVESGSEDDHNPESHSPKKGDTDVDKPESKDGNATPSHDDPDDGDVAKSLTVDSDSADPTNIGLDIGPKANDGQPMPKIATKEEVVASCREGELKQNRTENEELNKDEAESGNQSELDRNPKGFNTENGQDGTENTNQADSKTETKDLEAAGVTITSRSSEEKETAEHPEPLNAQQDEETGSSCLDPLAEQVHESSRKEAEGVDSPQPSHQDSNDEDDNNEDDEGQSFDFDDLDTEGALESTESIIPEQEGVEKGLDVVTDETNVGGSEMTQSNSETHKKMEDKLVDSGDEKVTVDEVNHLVAKADPVPQQDQNSLPPGGSSPKEVENVCEEKQNAPKGKDLAVASEESTENISASVKEGLDVIQQDLDSPKIVDQNVADKDAPPSGKDAKKSTKKGKGKGKEDCKMS